MFDIAYTTAALKVRKKMQPKLRTRIAAKIEEVAEDPFAPHPNVKPLTASDAFRLRVGDWRIIFELDKANKVMTVLIVMHRNEGY